MYLRIFGILLFSLSGVNSARIIDLSGIVGDAIGNDIKIREFIVRNGRTIGRILTKKRPLNLIKKYNIESVEVFNARVRLGRTSLVKQFPSSPTNRKLMAVQKVCNATRSYDTVAVEFKETYKNSYEVSSNNTFNKETVVTNRAELTLSLGGEAANATSNFSTEKVETQTLSIGKSETKKKEKEISIARSQKIEVGPNQAVFALMYMEPIKGMTPWDIPFIIADDTRLKIRFNNGKRSEVIWINWGQIKHELRKRLAERGEKFRLRGHVAVNHVNAGSVTVIAKEMNEKEIKRNCPGIRLRKCNGVSCEAISKGEVPMRIRNRSSS